MFEYTIANFPDKELFFEQCEALEENVPGLEKDKQVTDVDGTLIRLYSLNGKKLTIFNATDFGIYINSEFDINPYFKANN